MKRLSFTHYSLGIVFLVLIGISAAAQQPAMTEKQNLVTKFRKLTGANNVNLEINVSFEDVKKDLIGTVDNDMELTDAQKQELKKSAIEAYDRLDKQLKEFLADRPMTTTISENAIYQVYDQTFSESELRELIAFYNTALGQKALQFLRTLSTQVQKSFQSLLFPKIQEFITPKIKTEGDQLKQKIQEAKTKKP